VTISTMVPISWKFTGKPWDLNSLPLTPDEVWAKLDLPPEEVRASLNVLIGVLNSVTAGSSGAKNIAMTAIPAVGTQADVQAVVEALITRLQAVTASLSGAKFIGVETIAGLTGNDVQTLLIALKTLADGYNTAQTGALTTHKTSADHNGTYFTETELGATTGAGLVGATAPTGLTGTTTQALINALKTAIDNTVLGQIPDRSLTTIKHALASITTAELSFDVATQAELTAHLADDASLTAKGHVQLSNSTISTSETLAATASSVKVAMDKANAASTVIVVSGVYTGDSTTKTITVGFTPKAVFINRNTSVMKFTALSTAGAIKTATTGALTLVTNTKIVSGGFQINDADASNFTGNSYEYAAIG